MVVKLVICLRLVIAPAISVLETQRLLPLDSAVDFEGPNSSASTPATYLSVAQH
jgi:hypothetical protein